MLGFIKEIYGETGERGQRTQPLIKKIYKGFIN
jgi:hypothetical protein